MTPRRALAAHERKRSLRLMPDEAPLEWTSAEEDEGFLMTNLYPRRTGLPMTVWVGPRAGARHDVRINVSTSPGERIDLQTAAVVGVRPEPHLVHGHLSRSDLEQVATWIKLNEDMLLRHRTGEYDGMDVAENMKRLPR